MTSTTRRAVALYGSLHRAFAQTSTIQTFGLVVALAGWISAITTVVVTVWQIVDFGNSDFDGFGASIRLQAAQASLSPFALSLVAAALGHLMMLASAHVGLSPTIVEEDVGADDEPVELEVSDASEASDTPVGPVEVVLAPDGTLTCPTCGTEYRAGVEIDACAECGTVFARRH